MPTPVQDNVINHMNKYHSKESIFGEKIFGCYSYDEFVLGLNPRESWLVKKSLEIYKRDNRFTVIIDNKCFIVYHVNSENKIAIPNDYGMSEMIFKEIVRCSSPVEGSGFFGIKEYCYS